MKKLIHLSSGVSRRHFIRASAIAGAALLSPWPTLNLRAEDSAPKRTATDQVTLGKTGIKLSRLGMGTGSSNGHEQTQIGKEGFNSLVHYAYDHGITYLDTAQAYATFEWIGDAIKGLPREKLFIQSKVPGKPKEVLSVIDRHRKTFDTDYIDSLLVHCRVEKNWTDEWKYMMDAFDEAKEKKWIRAKGVSCHSLPALRAATTSDWPETHLVRVNPQGSHMDGEEQEVWNLSEHKIDPVIEQIKTMHAKGHGVIGMKIIGNGDFKNPDDREKSIRYAMSHKEIDAIVIGFTKKEQIDEAIERMNRALKEV
jgi:predicted aldo/keto reductase-like oxidoreductase